MINKNIKKKFQKSWIVAMLPPGLYLVSCPIGNDLDITLRALAVLKEADVIAAEDTRAAGRILAAHDISAAGRLISCHEHNEEQRSRELLDRVEQGQSLALMSDAGTPSVSDPGFYLVREAIARHIRVVPIPGVSAAVAALSVSGLPTDAFVFIGFPPKKKGPREKRLTELADQSATVVAYESPRRIRRTLRDMNRLWGDRRAVLCREMTKRYEEFLRGRLSELAEELDRRDSLKGEITLVVAGREDAAPVIDKDDLEAVIRRSTDSTSRLAAGLAARYGLARGRLYDEIVRIRNSDPSDSHE